MLDIPQNLAIKLVSATTCDERRLNHDNFVLLLLSRIFDFNNPLFYFLTYIKFSSPLVFFFYFSFS